MFDFGEVNMKKRWSVFFLGVFVFGFLILFSSNTRADTRTNVEDNCEDADNLMVVAHPDDESLWGGSHLLKDKYFVVCVTCGSNEIRNREFKRAMNKSGSCYVSFNYPDLVDGIKEKWGNYYFSIENDIKNIINQKKWKTIVTHNPDGEYGHIHHRMVSDIVTSIADKQSLYYFDVYNYKASNECNDLCQSKLELLSVYKSQTAIINNHVNTIKYENFISYYDWKDRT